MTAVEALGPMERFQNFFKSFKDENGAFKYRQIISQMAISGATSLVIDFEDLLTFDSALARSLIEKPDEYLKYAGDAAWTQLKIEDPEYAEDVKSVNARFRNLPEKTTMRTMGSENIGKLVLVDGILVRATSVQPLLMRAAFKCRKCGTIQYVEQSGTFLKTPIECTDPACRRRGPFEFVQEESQFINSQEIRIQERPEDLPPGQLPRSVDVKLLEDLVGITRPGDRVSITGIVRAVQEFVPRRGRLRTFDLHLDANYIDVSGKEPEIIQVSPEEEKQIIGLAKDPMIHRKIVRSIAPSIYGYEDVKEAVMYLLFGGVPKTLLDGVTIRGDLNLLLIGDPGTAKSQLLQYVARIAPRGLYTSGRGSTAAGLTAAVIREKAGGMSLEAGALVLADKGICCIDEIDKMRPEDRVAIHEAMEQQSFHGSVEIILADGTKVEIGKLVDNLFKSYHDRIVEGKNCEILPIDDLNISILTTDFKRIYPVKINRVSRHIAPKYFVQLTYSNGRTILVTPEHPVFVFMNGKITTVPAADVNVNDFVPAPTILPVVGSRREFNTIEREHFNEKVIRQPSEITDKLSQILGYLVSEGHCYSNNGYYEVGITNSNSAVLKEMRGLMLDCFGISPFETVKTDRGNPRILQRYISKSLYRFMKTNVSEVISRAREKRIPSVLMGSTDSMAFLFLQKAFIGDGFVDSERFGYSTASRKLAEDYQDLLLKLRIRSYITHDRTMNVYKVVITGTRSMKLFMDKIVLPTDYRKYRIQSLVYRSKKVNRLHEVFPSYYILELRRACRLVNLPLDKRLHPEYVRKGYGITVLVASSILKKIEQKIHEIEFSRGRFENSSQAKKLMDIEKCKRIIERIASLIDSDICWLRIKEKKIIPKEGSLKTDWVYDVTVEPTRAFISHGLVLHNTVSVAKGGIVATLNARSSILAAANPALGRYDPYRTVTENISLPVTILSRFDLIFVIRDEPERELDTRMAEHILSLHRTGMSPVEPSIPLDLLRKYVSYARHVRPILTASAVKRLEDFYLQMRSTSESKESPVAITARQLEALVRLAEARARAALRPEITVEDAEAVILLMKKSLEQVGIDVASGKYDIDIIMTGKPKSLRDKLQVVLSSIVEMEKVTGMVKEEELYERLKKDYEIDQIEASRLIDQLTREGTIYSPRPGYLKKT